MENNQNNEDGQPEKSNLAQEAKLTVRSLRYLLLGAISLSLLSLFLPGGFFISIGGLICAVIALRKVIKLTSKNPALNVTLDRVRSISIVCTVICGVIFALNALVVFVIYPMMVELIQSGALEDSGINTEYLKELINGSSGKTSKW